MSSLIAVIGGGPAGFFSAIFAKTSNPYARVIILEKNAVCLSKVKISGGGRCNVTHACFEPKELVQAYPRGNKELLGPFHRFQPRDVIHWFEIRGVKLKTEEDGRIFPVTNRSETIIEVLFSEIRRLGIDVLFEHKVENIEKHSDFFKIFLKGKDALKVSKIILATGGLVESYRLAQNLNHKIVTPVPSLFTFNCPSSPLKEFSGISIRSVKASLLQTSYVQKGPILITHFGFSGPVILKLSAWASRFLAEQRYKATLSIDWVELFSFEQILEQFVKTKQKHPRSTPSLFNSFAFPKQLWKMLFQSFSGKYLENYSKEDLVKMTRILKESLYYIEGKTTHKEEFVTAGGIDLKQVNFQTMESKCCPGLYFAGEVLDIDGITGGFNFQNAWTTGYIAGTCCGQTLNSPISPESSFL